ncbi:MAG: SurA N-terminal domain-containing protein [Yoonia sp.]|nr:SurA N-terminal domain-containing protein [Yoonia sp.]
MASAKKPRYFLWIIMGLLVVGLLGFGTGGLSGNLRTVGEVGDKPITVIAYQRALNEQLRGFEAQVGTSVSFQQAQQFGLDQAALSQVVTRRTLDNEAAQLGISVGDERVRDEVLRVPAFGGIDGQFDRESYRFALQQSGLTETDFEMGIREEISRTLLQGAVVGGVPLPNAYADVLSQFIGEARKITWAKLTTDALTAPVAGPSDSDLQTYYDANAADFTQPELRNITYAWLTPNMIQDEVAIDETALRALYDERIADFIRPERRLVERLVFVDAESADAALASLSTGTTFEDLVEARGLDLADVDLGDVAQGDLATAGDAVFAATPGDVVGPINTTLGPALFRMNAVLAAQEQTFEDASSDLREELSAARAARIIEDGIDRMNDLLAGGAAIEDLAEQTDMQLGTIVWFEGGQDDIAAYESFRAAAAAVQTGDFAALTDMEDGGLFALRLDSVTAPALRDFDQVRDEVEAGWRVQAMQAAVLAQAKDTAQGILPLTGFDTLGLEPTVEAGLTRRSFVGGTPPTFLPDVFEMSIGEVRVIDNGTDAIIVRLDGIAAPDADDAATAAEKQLTAETAAGGISQDIFNAYSAAVQNRTDVVINQAAVNAVNATLQ